MKIILSWCLGLTLSLPFRTEAQIDLHAHLHMKPGMGFFLNGDFESEIQTDHWSQRRNTRASGKALAQLDSANRPKLIVLSLYGHPYFGYSFKRDGFHFDRKKIIRNATEQEYLEFKSWVEAHADRFALVKNAAEAKAAIAQGKTAIVLSIEGAWGNFESEEDYRIWIDERGVAIVTPVHMTPDDLGKTALMNAIISFANSTFDFLESVWNSRGDCLKTFCKSQGGFTDLGIQTIERLMKKKVWIDLAHMNEIEVATLIQKFETNGNPPGLVTHTQIREAFTVERGLGDLEKQYILKNDGIIGLIPAHHMIPNALEKAQENTIKNHPEEKNAASAAKGLTCISDLDLYRNTVSLAINQMGSPKRVAMASDINAPLNGLSPGCGEVSQWLKETNAVSTESSSLIDLHRRGYYSYSQWNTLHRFAQPSSEWGNENLGHFLNLWSMIRP
jgi:microsomal dipeptidase-like Zn-dependent dipeptidase